MDHNHFYIVTGVLLLVFYLLQRVTRNYLALSSLKIPGPLFAKISSKWQICHFICGEQMNVVHALHLKYGPIVQIGPRELSFSSGQAFKEIYGSGTRCLKAPIWATLGKEGLFQMLEPERHRERRKRVTHVFAMNVLFDLEPCIQEQVKDFVDLLQDSKGRPFDVVYPTRMLALDISGEVLLGESFHALRAEKSPHFINILDYAHPCIALDREFPWVMKLVRMIPSKKVQVFCASAAYIYDFGETQMRDTIAKYGRDAKRRNIMTRLITGDPEKGILPLTDRQIADEIGNLVYAATDTTGASMAYVLYEMACHPEWQDKLRAELKSLGARESDFSYLKLMQSPTLAGVQYEAQRLHPGVAIGPPRITPPEGCFIDGIFIPGNTVLHCQAVDVQSSPTAFPEPEKFNPQRWIDTDGGTTEMKNHMAVWGAGEHLCAGQNLAIMEMKIMAARVFEKFKVRIKDELVHKDMEMNDHFVINPRGGQGLLVFEEIVD